MAKNYTMAEAARILRAGVDKAVLIDLGKKFPLTMMELAKQNEAGLLFAMKLPEKLTARKFEMLLRDGVESDEDDDNITEDVVEDVAEKPVKASKKSEDAPEPKSWKGMSQYQKKKARELGEAYVAACKALDKAAVEEEDDIPAPKKAAKKVKKAAPVEDDDFDVDDEEEEEDEVKPAKKAAKKEKKEEKKPAKKTAKKVEPDEDEDEDDDDFDDFDFDDDDDE